MTQKTLSLRLEEDLFEKIEQRAKSTGKTKTELVKELLVLALDSSRDAEYGAILQKLNSIEKNLGKSITKSALASAANRYYGKQIASFMLELGHYLQGKDPLSKEEKLMHVNKQDERAGSYARDYVNS